MRRFRLLALFLCLVLTFSNTVSALADEEGTSNNDISWNYDDENDVPGSIGEGYSEEPTSYYDYVLEQQALFEQQYISQWNEAIDNNQLPDLSQYDATDDLQANNNAPLDRVEGSPNENTVYQIVSQDQITPTPTPYVEDRPRGPVNPDTDPDEDPRGNANPDNDPIPTPPIVQLYVPADNQPVRVAPAVEEPEKVVYNVDLEVGRFAKITTTNLRNDSKKSSNTKILHDPQPDVSSFNSNVYTAKGVKPGDATLTFKNDSKNFVEEWNIHVYCRPLDFEKPQYVVKKTKDDYEYFTMYLKYFEYASEFAYDFKWTSSNPSVAIMYPADPNATYCRVRIDKNCKEGATVITVADKYGNSESAVLIVKSDKTATSKDDGKTGTDTKSGSDVSKLSAKELKKLVKATEMDLDLSSSKKGKMTMKWTDNAEFDLDGYEIEISSDGKKFKLKKDITKAATVKFTYKEGKKNKKYYFRVRGYKTINDKKVYTAYSDVISGKFKK